MPDTEQEKQAAQESCYKCKYKDTCGLLKFMESITGKYACIIGVK